MRGQNHTHEKNGCARSELQRNEIHDDTHGWFRHGQALCAARLLPLAGVRGSIREDKASILLTGHHREPPPATPLPAA